MQMMTSRDVGQQCLRAFATISVALLFSCGGGESSEQVPTSPIVFETAIVNLGEMVPDATQTLSVKVKNVSSLPQSIENVISDCSCAAPTWTEEPIAPGATVEIGITVESGSKQGITFSKRVTVIVKDAPPVSLGIEGSVQTFVTYGPDSVDAPSDAVNEPSKTEIVLESADSTLFTINAVLPAVNLVQQQTPALRQIVSIDWDKWRASSRPMKIEILTSHPKAPTLPVIVRRFIEKK